MDRSPCHFPSKEAWCAWRNSTMERRDIEWAVDQNGDLYLRDNPRWSDANRQAENDRMEAERKRFNWRLQHPIGDE